MAPPGAAPTAEPQRSGWHGRLDLHYRHSDGRSVAHDRHIGPLRVLQSLYPEGPGICHHVLVHPPGGLAGGDVLDIHARLDAGTHALVTTPGAARFYRSEGAAAVQQVRLDLADGARLEWLPLETIAYTGCRAENRLTLSLAPGAEAIGWDILALGLPAADAPFVRGEVLQHLAFEPHWLERGRIDAADTALLDAPLGWAGRRTLATLWLASGTALPAARRDALLEAARTVTAASPLSSMAGVTAPNPHVLVLRALADRVEPLMQLLVEVRARWREVLWALPPVAPRIWRM